MRAALVIERLDPVRGGRERSTAELAVELAARGCVVTVVCMHGTLAGQPRGFPLHDAHTEGPYVVELGRGRGGRAARLEWFRQAVRNHLAEARYDVVHAMLPLPEADVYQLRGGTLPGLREAHLRPLGVIGRRVRRWTWPLNRSRALLERWEGQLMREGRAWCVPVSRMVAEEIECHYGRKDRVRTILNGVRVLALTPEARLAWREPTRRSWSVAPDACVLLMPAMQFGLKGGREALAALAAYRRQSDVPVQLVVLGGRDLPEHAQRLASAHSLGDGVVFEPAVAEMAPAYAAADGVLLLSWYDPCSRVVLEAIGLGVPSITTALNGASELLDGGAGVVVPRPSDRRAVVAAIAAVADPDRRAQMVTACAAAAPRVAIGRHVDSLLDLYREILRS